MISLSTAWCPKQASSLPQLFAAGRKIGFTSFELGVSAAPFDVGAVLDAVDRDGIEISSVHAVCAEREVPEPTRRGDWVAEPDADLRREGVRLVKETLDLARRVGASVVVLHGGILPMPEGPMLQFELYRLVSHGVAAAQRQPILDRVLAERELLVPAYLRALETSLKELCDHAPDVTIAIENRYYMHDLPHGDEFERVFDRVAAPNLRYWHDVGHAHVLERIGFLHHGDLLERYTGRLAGMHLHDIRGFTDHCPPGTGDFDFGSAAAALPPQALRVMEIASDHPPKAVRRGREHLVDVCGIS